jgi:hypothetical protein
VARSFTSQTIVAGNLAYSFEVTVNGDLNVESNEAFFVNLNNVTGATVADGQGLGTIQNDDSAPLPSLTINDVTANEGNAGATTFTFTVNSSLPAPAGGITFDIATQDGTATTANNDYVARALTTQTIPAGQQTYLFEVTVNGDLNVEPNETFFVNLTNVFGAAVADGQGQGTIQNDDTANLVISQVYGGGGNAGALFTNDFVEIFNRGATTVNFASTPYSVQYAGATANFGSNKTDLTSGIIGPGKYFLVQLSSGGPIGSPLPAADATGSINMAATAGKVALVIGTTALNAANCPAGATVSDLVGYGTTADCFEGLGRAPAPSATVADFRKSGGCTDTNDNAADFLVSAPAPRNSSSPFNDCSAGPPPPTLTINDVSANEGNGGTTTFTFTVALSSPAPAGGVSFDIATADGSATDGNPAGEDTDYVARSFTSQTIVAGNLAYSFEVTVNGDLNVEPNETFFVNLTNVTGATVADGQGLGTIQNDDSAPAPALTINDVTANEGNAGATTFTFTVNSSLPAPAGGITFDIATQDGTATTANNDYVAQALTTQTIPVGQQTYLFEVTVNGDLNVEPNETFLVNLNNVFGATVADGQGLGTIQNDDTANLVISQVYGGGGNAGALFTNDFVEIFNRGATTVNFASTPYSVQYAGATANFGSNKTDLTSGIIAPGKYFLVQLSSGGTTGSPLPAADATGSINMAATAGKVALVVGTTALNAANCPAGATVSDLVGYGTTADCFEGLGRAPAPSATVADFRKSGGCTDTNDNAADFLVSAPAPRNSSSPFNDCSAGPPLPTLTINDVSANEGNSGTTTFTFTVALSSPAPAGGVSFDIATADGTATDGNPAGEDTDYVARSFTSQTIVAGNLAYSFEVTVNGDLNVESNETFFVNLTNVAGATVADGQGLGTIQNDDSTPVAALTINDVTANEGNAGATTFAFTVSSSLPAPAGGITFDIATQDGTATTANNDYVARALTTQTIPAGQQTYLFEVTVNGDLNVEPNETFFVNLNNVFGATVADGQGQGTIQNDDTANLVISQVYGGGGNAGALFTSDFVEIFNRGATTVNFASTPYSIQYAGATANFGSNKTDLTSGTIGPGKYFLVQLSSGGTTGSPLPAAADATGSINMAATAGKVALAVGTTSLPVSTCPGDDGSPPLNPNNAAIADFVGYGSSAVCFEGPSAPAPAPSATAADFRKTGGCIDTNDNAADFLVSAPAPRNSNSPLNDCSAAPPPPPNMTINDVTVLEGNSGTTTATFTVSLSTPAPAGGVSFDIATQNGSATAASGDYISKTLAGQVIPAGEQSYSFEVIVNGDTALEPDETFLVNLSNVSGATVTDSQGVGTIQNDDQPALSINDLTITEGNTGPKAFTFTVSLSAPAAVPVTFDISTADGTAQDDVPPTEDNDYVAKSLTGQTIPAGSQTYAFVVTVNGDINIEPSETFFVNVTNVSGATVVKGQGQATIVNDDLPMLSINDVSLNEGNTGTTIFTFTVHSSLAAPPGGISFDIATADVTAQDDNPVSEDNDYVARSLTGQLIPAGQQNYTFNVTVNGDNAVEFDETFLVNITNPSRANISDGQGQGTIRNDDVVSRVEVSPSSATINRGNTQQFTATAFDAGNQPIPGGSFTWESSNPAVATINSNGLATGVGIGTTTITATTPNGMGGTVSGTATLTVRVPLVINEALPQVPLDSGGTTAIEGDSNRDNVRNSDDDEFVELLNNSNAPVDISGVIISDSSSNRFTFPANTILAAGRAVVVFGGGAPPVNDPAFGGALIFTTTSLALGDTGDTITVKLPVSGSDVVIDSLAYGTGNPIPAPGAQSLTRSPDAAIGSAGGGYVTHTTATNAAGRVFSPGTRADGTPFGSPPITLVEVLPASATVNIGGSQSFTGHAYSGGNEVFNVSFIWDSSDTSKATVAPATGRTTTATAIAAGSPTIRARAGGQQGAATLTVDPPTPTLTINDVSANEGNGGPTTFTFTVSLSGPAPSAGVSFDIATADGSAQDGIPGGEDNDYVARTLTSQTIAAGNTSYTFNVTVNGDVNIESNETFFVNVTNISGATIGDPQGLGTIQNDDSPTLTINDVSASEGNTGATIFTFTVTSSSPAPAGGIIFDIATQDNTATAASGDYVAKTLTSQTITAGNTTYTFTVTVNGDLLVEPNETFFVNLTNVSGANLTDGQGLGTILNEDSASLVISQIYAGGGNSGALFTNDFVEIFNRGNTIVNFATTPYSVQYAGATSNFGSNKADLTSGVIAPGKYFLVQLSSGGAIGSPLPAADASGSINMAATAGKVALVVGTTNLNAASCPAGATVSDLVGYGTTADCFEGLGRAPAPSATAADFRKSGGCTDTNDNAADFLVSAPAPRNSSSPSNNCVAGAPPSLSISDATVTEGNSGTTTATFTVTLSAPAPSTDITFDIATQNNTATTANSDYVAKTLTGQIIPAGQTSYTFTVTVNGDVAIENDESFFVNVTNVSGATLLDGQAVGTIQNDDFPGLSINDISLTEGNAGTKLFTFTVSLSVAAPTGGVTFDIATADGTAQDDTPATEDNDYVAKSLTGQTIPAGSQTYTFDVTVNGDLNIETNETFFVNVTNVTGATVSDGQGQGTIQNDDSPSLSINDVSANETNSITTFTFTVTSSLAAPAGGITFDIATADGTAQDDNPVSEDNDYVAKSLTAQTITVGNNTYTFSVTVNGDLQVEPNETFFVNLTNVSGATVSDGQGQGTIQNDDTANLVISQIYPGGNNAGATYRNDFIEIFNRGTTTVNFAVTPYSLQYAGATAAFGAASTKTDLTSGTIAPGQYFLVQEAGGTTNGVALPTPDAIGTIAMAATAGKVALVIGTTAVAATACPGDDAAPPTNPIGNNIVDFVGYGTGTNCFEGAAVAPFSTSTAGGLDPDARSVIRTVSCTDNNNNSTDFSNPTTAPVARNTATTAAPCP